MAAEPVLLAVEEPKFCSLFCKVAASPLEVASVKRKGCYAAGVLYGSGRGAVKA